MTTKQRQAVKTAAGIIGRSESYWRSVARDYGWKYLYSVLEDRTLIWVPDNRRWLYKAVFGV